MMLTLAPACIREYRLCKATSENKSRKGTVYLKSKMRGTLHNTGNIPAQLNTYFILVLLSKKKKKSKTNSILNDDFHYFL